MGVAADAADRMALHAQPLASAAVAARARGRIPPCFAAMQVISCGEANPAERVRAAVPVVVDAAGGVTAHAALGSVAGRADARLGASLEAVPRGEPGAMHARRERICEPPRRR